MGMATILIMLLGRFEYIFVSSTHGDYMKFGYNWLSGFWGDVWKCQTMRVLSQRSKNDLDLLYSQIFMY